MTGYTVEVAVDKVVDWQVQIRLKPWAVLELNRVAGFNANTRHFAYDDLWYQLEPHEPWAWCIDSQITPIKLWFRDPRHATYFKLLWGGK